jgi:hypothetical protein
MKNENELNKNEILIDNVKGILRTINGITYYRRLNFKCFIMILLFYSYINYLKILKKIIKN